MSRRPNRTPVLSPEIAALVADGDDADLLHIIGEERERNREWADAALMELHTRHAALVYAACLRLCRRYLAWDEAQAATLLSWVMWRVYETAERFDPTKAKCAGDRERTTAAVRLWMIRNAKWLAKDVLTGSCSRNPLVTGGSAEVEAVGREDDEPFECSAEVLATIDRLTERERHIVLAYYFATDGDSGGPVPPHEHVDTYCARRWGITGPYVRQIRKRALDQLREWLTPAVAPASAR